MRDAARSNRIAERSKERNATQMGHQTASFDIRHVCHNIER